jgi:aldose 1-epimerase
MPVSIKNYPSVKNPGKYDNESFEYTLTHSSGAVFSVINYGATITRILVPDRNGKMEDVELGHCDLDGYLKNTEWHGTSVGRSANRIKGAAFSINGRDYKITANEGKNNLHTGVPGFHSVFWKGTVFSQGDARKYLDETGILNDFSIEDEAVLFEYVSPDGACGFPGNLDAQILYAWTSDATLLIVFTGKSDAETIFAPTNHSYFNLAGQAAGSVSEHVLFVDADTTTDKFYDNVPDGTISDVRGTPLDFTVPSPVRKALGNNHPQLECSKGIDQNFCLNSAGDARVPAAVLSEPSSGRKMEVFTNFPGIQIYAGNHLGGSASKNSTPYMPYGGICLEAQMYPDSFHHPNFPSALIKHNVRKCYLTGYRFSAT